MYLSHNMVPTGRDLLERESPKLTPCTTLVHSVQRLNSRNGTVLAGSHNLKWRGLTEVKHFKENFHFEIQNLFIKKNPGRKRPRRDGIKSS